MADTDIDEEAGTAGDEQEIETRARRMGWAPKEEFRGDPARWKEAKEFLDRGENELPILRDRYRALEERSDKEIGGIKKQLDETLGVLKEFRDFSRTAEERAYKKAKDDLEARMEYAVGQADTDAFKAAKRDLDQLEAPKAAPKPEEARTTAPAVPVEITQFIADNPWFNNDPELRAYAGAVHDRIMRERPGVPLAEQLQEAKREVVARFPDKFSNPRREQAAAVTAPGGSSPRKKGKGYDDLPGDAKKICDRFVKTIPGYKREEYVKVYFAGEE